MCKARAWSLSVFTSALVKANIKRRLSGVVRNVGGVARRHLPQGVALLLRPVDAARLVERLQRALKLARVHLVESGFLLGGADALHVLQDRRAVRLPQRLEHAAALDARKLRVVARKNEFCASGARGGGDCARCSVATIAASSTIKTVFLFQAVRPLSSAFNSLAMVLACLNPSPRICCATSFVHAKPITFAPSGLVSGAGRRLRCGSCRFRPRPTASQNLPRRVRWCKASACSGFSVKSAVVLSSRVSLKPARCVVGQALRARVTAPISAAKTSRVV